jgi:phage tail-like protein
LIAGEEDWRAVADTSPPGGGAGEWDAALQSRGLQPKIPVFPRGRRSLPLETDMRRGAASDRFGTWYWIGNDRRTLFRAPSGTGRAVAFWEQAPDCAPEATGPGQELGGFASAAHPPQPALLSGLAVTDHHYLVVGSLEPAGLLLFDLHSGGEPLVLEIPAQAGFAPFDLAPAADGGVWVLDRDNRRLWGLDRYFRIRPHAAPLPGAPNPGGFQPEDEPGQPLLPPTAPAPQGLGLPDAVFTALEVLPDGSLLLLAEPDHFGGNSRLYHYRLSAQSGSLLPPAAPLTLPGLSGIAADAGANAGRQPVRAYDMAFHLEWNLLIAAEQDGNQAIAYRLDLPSPGGPLLGASPQAIYLPMHYFGGRALAAGYTPGGKRSVFYDVTPNPGKDEAVRWMRLHEIDQPRYTRLAWLETPPFDSRERGCTWHRMFLDACIPPETQVLVETRANDDLGLLLTQAYQPEPAPYLRGRGPEIPYWEGWASSDPQAATTGTWELLFQQARGRYMQVRLILTGNGRFSPQIRALRAYYPRFSYQKNFLPAAYAEDRGSASFMERFLANMEGFFTDLEGKISTASMLFDPRSAPSETLDWLAAWMGLVLDPLWAKLGSPPRTNGGAQYGSVDRRRLMIRFARRLYDRRGTPDGLRFALLLLLDPCLEATLKRLELAATIPDLPLMQELESLGLPYPTLATGEAELEDLLFRYVLSAQGRSRVRIVERWQTRQGMALQAGDVTTGPGGSLPTLEQELESGKHRFTVLVPENLPYEYQAMVDKIVQLEKPVHTQYDLKRFWDLFLVGQTRLGLDTVLGEDGRFLPILLGRDYLAEGYLESGHPMNVDERAVSDRDRMGDMRL